MRRGIFSLFDCNFIISLVMNLNIFYFSGSSRPGYNFISHAALEKYGDQTSNINILSKVAKIHYRNIFCLLSNQFFSYTHNALFEVTNGATIHSHALESYLYFKCLFLIRLQILFNAIHCTYNDYSHKIKHYSIWIYWYSKKRSINRINWCSRFFLNYNI